MIPTTIGALVFILLSPIFSVIGFVVVLHGDGYVWAISVAAVVGFLMGRLTLPYI